jgi:hypothetical protein
VITYFINVIPSNKMLETFLTIFPGSYSQIVGTASRFMFKASHKSSIALRPAESISLAQEQQAIGHYVFYCGFDDQNP